MPKLPITSTVSLAAFLFEGVRGCLENRLRDSPALRVIWWLTLALPGQTRRVLALHCPRCVIVGTLHLCQGVDRSEGWCRNPHHQRHDQRHRNQQDDALHPLRNLLLGRAAAGCTTGSPRPLGAHLLRDVALGLCPLVQADTLASWCAPAYQPDGPFLLLLGSC
jgi:hypothetical protein